MEELKLKKEFDEKMSLNYGEKQRKMNVGIYRLGLKRNFDEI